MSGAFEASAGDLVNDGRCFACGPKSEHGLHLVFALSGENSVRAQTTLAPAFQGWVGVAHGGVAMMLLDEAMAHAAGAAGFRGVTGEMRARFRKPVPTGRPLDIGGRVMWRRGHVLGVAAEVHDASGTLLVSGEGRFVARGTVAPGMLGVPDLG